MTETLTVELGERRYPIAFEADGVERLKSALSRLASEKRKVAVITDRHVRDAAGAHFWSAFGSIPCLRLEPGEGTKSVAGLGQALDFLAGESLGRTGVVFAVGGGIVGDLAGYAAASYLRGVEYCQVPTTLLAMVDSSVGGKTGINLPAGKNLAGAFHQPKAVFISTDVLKSLPPREFAAGAAEVIKYGLLADRALFDSLEQAPLTLGSPALSSVIRRCCELKAGIVQADERELAADGGRALLNLGHTFGHAIEQVTGYKAYLHGEAVAIGLCAAARLSRNLGSLSDADVARIDRVVEAHGLSPRLRQALPVSELMAAAGRDKKVRAGTIRFVVLTAVGTAVTRDDVPPALAEQAFREVGAS